MKPSMIRSYRRRFFGALTHAVALMIASSASTAEILVADADAHVVTSAAAGAILSVDPAASTSASPIVIAAADQGAPFEFIAGIAVSPRDGSAAITDWRATGTAAIYRSDCATGALTTLTSDPRLDQPLGVTFMPDGRVVVVDWEADPSGLGPDGHGGPGRGALFIVDTRACTSGCAVSVLSDGTRHPFGPTVRSAFVDPVAVAYDRIRDRIIVADLHSPDSLSAGSILLAVDPFTGRVSVVASNAAWSFIVGLAMQPNGRILAVDTGIQLGDSSVWEIDPNVADTTANATKVTGGGQYSLIEDVDVDATGRIFLAESGDYDQRTGTFITPPTIFEIDRSNADPATNARLVNDNPAFITPVSLATRDGCAPPPGQLALNRRALRTSASARPGFTDDTCLRTPWAFCTEAILAGALEGFVLTGEAAPLVPDSLWLYQHSDGVSTMKLERRGSDLVCHAN